MPVFIDLFLLSGFFLLKKGLKELISFFSFSVFMDELQKLINLNYIILYFLYAKILCKFCTLLLNVCSELETAFLGIKRL